MCSNSSVFIYIKIVFFHFLFLFCTVYIYSAIQKFGVCKDLF